MGSSSIGYSDLPEGFSVAQPVSAQYSDLPEGFSAVAAPQPSLSTNISNDWAKRQQEAGDIGDQYANGTLNMPGALAATASTGLGAVTDVAGEGIKSAWNSLPSAVTKPIESGASYMGDQFAKSPQGILMRIAAPAVKSEYTQDMQDHPNWEAGFDLAGNMAKAAPLVEGAATLPSAIKYIGDATPIAAKAVRESSPMDFIKETSSVPGEVTLPTSVPKIRNYDQVKAANDALSDNTSAHYANAESLGATLTPEASQMAKDTLQQEVGNDLDAGLHPQTIGALNLFNKKAAQGLDWQAIDNTRKKLNMIAYDSNANANDIGAAKQAIRSIDGIFDTVQQNPDLLANGTPDAIDALKAARDASSTEQQHSTIAAIVRKANGNPNVLQSQFKSLYDDEGAFSRFSDDNQALIKGIAHPGKLVSSLQTIGKMGPGGNGTINVAEAAAMLSMNPVAQGLAVAGGVTGAGANMIRSNLIKGSTEKLLQNIEGTSKAVSEIPTPYNDAEYEAALAARGNQAAPPAPLALPAPSIKMPANQSGLYKQISSTIDTTRPEFPLVQDTTTGETRHMTQDEAHSYIQAGQHESDDLPRGLKIAQAQRANTPPPAPSTPAMPASQAFGYTPKEPIAAQTPALDPHEPYVPLAQQLQQYAKKVEAPKADKPADLLGNTAPARAVSSPRPMAQIIRDKFGGIQAGSPAAEDLADLPAYKGLITKNGKLGDLSNIPASELNAHIAPYDTTAPSSNGIHADREWIAEQLDEESRGNRMMTPSQRATEDKMKNLDDLYNRLGKRGVNTGAGSKVTDIAKAMRDLATEDKATEAAAQHGADTIPFKRGGAIKRYDDGGKVTVPIQASLLGTEGSGKQLAAANEGRRIKASVNQKPMNIGMFDDDDSKNQGSLFKRGGAIPTEAQKHAGNYPKDKISIHGLPISIETRKGEVRSGKDKGGKEWRVVMPASYGYIRKTEGADGEHVDCFIGPNPKSLRVYIIDQKHHDTGKFDEHKCLIGFATREAALAAYKAAYSDKKNRVMKVTKMLMPEFKQWLKEGNTKKPLNMVA